MSDKKTISICIPVFNESALIERAISEVEALFAEKLSKYALEIVVTDNGSSDATWSILQSLASRKPHLKAYRFSRNFGYQNSVFAGLSLATGDAVVELDADLEDPPQVICEFVSKWEEGFQVVYGVRNTRHGSRFLRVLFSLFYRILYGLSDLKIPRDTGDFRLLDRKVVDVLKSLPERNLYLRGLVTFLGFQQCPVRYDRQPRQQGASKFRFVHYVVLAIDALTAFSKTPLRMISVLGVFLFFGAMLLATYYIYDRIVNGVPVAGFTTLAVLSLFLHSMTFIFIGILGEYLSRVFDDSKFRPRVIISDALGDRNPPKWL